MQELAEKKKVKMINEKGEVRKEGMKKCEKRYKEENEDHKRKELGQRRGEEDEGKEEKGQGVESAYNNNSSNSDDIDTDDDDDDSDSELPLDGGIDFISSQAKTLWSIYTALRQDSQGAT